LTLLQHDFTTRILSSKHITKALKDRKSDLHVTKERTEKPITAWMLLDNCNAVTIDLASHYATVAIEGFIEVKQVQILCGKHTACQCFTICVHIFQQFSQLI